MFVDADNWTMIDLFIQDVCRDDNGFITFQESLFDGSAPG